jgi:hypothetical protein
MGGFDMSPYSGGPGGGAVTSGCGFGYSGPSSPSPHFSNNTNLIGCDPEVMQQGVDRADALQQQQIEAANSMLTQPTPVEQLSCYDQTTEIFSELGGIHSNPGQDINRSIGPNVQQPLDNVMQQFFGDPDGGSLYANITGGITDVINQAFGNITSQFSSLLGGGGGMFTAGPSTNCDMQEQAWLISQCIEMPTIPSLGDILGGQIGEMMGNIGNIGNMVGNLTNPDRLIQQVCSAANSSLQSMFGNPNDAFENAAQGLFEPVTDRVE